MSDIALGFQFIVTGIVIIFLTLTIMSISMWLIGRLIKEKRKTESFNENEIFALSLAIHQYRAEKEEIELGFEPVSNWKIQGRIESLERNE